MILLLLCLLEVTDVFLSTVCCTPGNCNFRLHHFIVLFDLFESTVKLVELFLGLEDALELLISLLFLAFILALEDLVLPFSFSAIPLHNVVVVVGPLEGRLHARQLMLNSVELHTGLLARLADLADGLFALAKFQVDAFVLIRKLLRQGVLQSRHEGLY